MARIAWRRPTRRELTYGLTVVATLVIITIVFVWFVRPWLASADPKQAVSNVTKPVARAVSKAVTPPPPATSPAPAASTPVVATPGQPPEVLTYEKAYLDMRDLANKTLDQNKELIAQNRELIN